jgi:hypothetical protein
MAPGIMLQWFHCGGRKASLSQLGLRVLGQLYNGQGYSFLDGFCFATAAAPVVTWQAVVGCQPRGVRGCSGAAGGAEPARRISSWQFKFAAALNGSKQLVVNGAVSPGCTP